MFHGHSILDQKSLAFRFTAARGKRTFESRPISRYRGLFKPNSYDTYVYKHRQGLDDERRFLLSLAAGAPEWSLLGIEHLEQLPGIRWKLHNLVQLQKTDAKKFAEQAD